MRELIGEWVCFGVIVFVVAIILNAFSNVFGF